MYYGHSHETTIIFEAIASHDLWKAQKNCREKNRKLKVNFSQVPFLQNGQQAKRQTEIDGYQSIELT